MLRLGGVSVLAALILSVFLLLSVRTFSVKAVSVGRGTPPLTLRLDYNVGSTALQAFMIPDSLPCSLSVLGHSGRVNRVLLDDVAEAVREIPENAEVVLTHRWLDTRGLGWNYGSTRIDWNGRAFVAERSGGRFFATLTLIAVSPLLIWTAIALASLGFRPQKLMGAP